MKRKVWILSTLIIVVGIILNTGCKKKETIPALTTTVVEEVTFKTAISGGSLANDGGSEITRYGVCWSTKRNPTIEDITSSGNGTKENFVCSITGLLENTKYYVRAFASNGVGTGYGNENSFTTSFAPDFSFTYNISGNTYEPELIEVINIFDEIHIHAEINDSFVTVEIPVDFTTGLYALSLHSDYEAVYGYGESSRYYSIEGTIDIQEYIPETLKLVAIFEFTGEDILTGDKIQITNGQFEVYY